jgi:hypothetical protein
MWSDSTAIVMIFGLFVMNAASFAFWISYDMDVSELVTECERIQWDARVNLLLLLVICITLTVTVGGSIVDTWVVHYLHTPDSTSKHTRRQAVQWILTTNDHLRTLIAQSVFIHIVCSILQITISGFWLWVVIQSNDTFRYIVVSAVCVLGGKLLSAGIHLIVALCQRQSGPRSCICFCCNKTQTPKRTTISTPTRVHIPSIAKAIAPAGGYNQVHATAPPYE